MAKVKKKIRQIVDMDFDDVSVCYQGMNDEANAYVVKSLDINNSDDNQNETKKGETQMSETDNKVETVSKADFEKALEEVNAKLAKAEKVNALTPEAFAHYDAIEKAEDKDEFLGKTADEQKAEVEQATAEKASETVEYNGMTLNKGDAKDMALLEAVKKAEELTARAEKAEKVAKAKENFGDLPLLDDEMLGVQKTFGDTEEGIKKFKNMIKPELIGTVRKSHGDPVDLSVDEDDVIEKAVAEVKKANPNLSDQEALIEAYRSDEVKEAFGE